MNVAFYRIYPLERHIHWFLDPDAWPAAAPVRGGPRVLPERVFQR